MSYHRSMLPLGSLGYPMPEMASYGLTDSDAILPNAKLCGSAKVIQSALKDQGFYTGQVDGILGSGSVAAIKKFSLANGIGSKSWPDPVFCAKLREKQNLLLNAEYEKRNPPPPPTPEQPGANQPPGTLNQPPATPPAQPPVVAAEEDNTLFIAAGVGVLALAAVGLYLATRLRHDHAFPQKQRGSGIVRIGCPARPEASRMR